MIFPSHKKQRNIGEWQYWAEFNSLNLKELLSNLQKYLLKRQKLNKSFSEKKKLDWYKFGQITNINFLSRNTKMFKKNRMI